jgi:signal transduction histidine kinase
LQLSDGSWLHFRAQDLIGGWQLQLGQIVIAGLPMLALVIVAMIALRSILGPLRRLADAVTRVGQGQSIVLEEQGPGDFRRLIRAYNEMQARIAAMIQDRTEALAAVGHDLRTPLARLRLNAESVTDSQTRNAFARDLDEMEQMLDSLLTFFRGDAHAEAPKLVDVAVLVATVVDDLQDRGFEITYVGPPHCDAELRAGEMKRAIGNLAENACHYGTEVVVQLMASESSIRIRVEDDGPGVPEADLQRIIEPFQRLDPARRRNTAGVGLGLTIASRIVTSAGGQLTLSNRTEGGLCAQIELPRQQCFVTHQP